MREYSKIYKVGSRHFRYNYRRRVLEYIVKETAKRRKDNEEWIREFGEPMWNFVNGVDVIDSIGLGLDNWRDGPEYWCEVYNGELSEELAWEEHLFTKYELPNYI